MKLFYTLSFLCLLGIFTANAQRETIEANNALIEYTGRIDFADSLAPKFSFSGVSIRANFTGTSVSAILDDDIGDNYFNVILNGNVHKVIHVTKGKQEYVLAEGLEDATHEIELFKRTELTFGKTQFFGFTLDAGKTLSAITNTRDVFIEYIGNSITCGYGNEGENGGTFSAETENHYMTYAAITSRNFNARHMAVSRSGIGVYRNYDGPATGSDECMTNLYTNVFLYDNNPKYDFAVQPDLVCINLGTNDFSTSGADSALYTDNYFRLIDTIQTKYTNPEIVMLLGPMMSGSDLTTLRGYLKFIADSANNKGKGKVSFFEMSAQTGDLGIAIDYHPTVAQHTRNAGELTDYIKILKGWAVQPQLMSVVTSTAKEIELQFNTDINSTDEDFSGFTISDGTNEFTINSAELNGTNAKIINVTLEEAIKPGAEIELNYTPGTIKSVEGLELKGIDGFFVENSLTETSINETDVQPDGSFIKLTFNKAISPDCSADGLSFFNDNSTYTIDSIRISLKNLMCYVSPNVLQSDNVYASYSGTGIFGKNDKVILNPFENMSIENGSTSTSINELVVEKSYSFWPNPNTTGLFNYKTDKLNAGNYQVINQTGKILSVGTISSSEGQISLGDNLPNGIYYMRIALKEQIEVHELILKN